MSAMNLVVIHLESVSQLILWNYRRELQAVWGLMGNSLSFRKFQSSSTSSMMAVTEFLHGNSAELDHNAVFTEKNTLARRNTNLFVELAANGYDVLGAGHPPQWRDDMAGWKVWPTNRGGGFHWHDSRADWLEDIRETVAGSAAAGRPFAVYAWDLRTHQFHDLDEKEHCETFAERFRHGFRQVNASVEDILAMLRREGVFEKTAVVLFGDHGDELWTHSLSGGHMHGQEPYASLCWTPMFISAPGIAPGVTDRLACLIDLKATILALLLPDTATTSNSRAFSGVDILSKTRELAFSQNLFALQREYDGHERALTKGYSVYDGEFRLMASSGGVDPDRRGMELFLDALDPENCCNLLDFFELDPDGIPTSFESRGAIHPHFRNVFKPILAKDLAQRYLRLRDALARHIHEKEQLAGPLGDGKGTGFPADAFRKVRKRKFYW